MYKTKTNTCKFVLRLRNFVDNHKARKYGPRIKHNQVVKVCVHPSGPRNRIIRPRTAFLFCWRRHVALHAPHSPGDDAAYKHSPPLVKAPQCIVRSAATGGGPHALCLLGPTACFAVNIAQTHRFGVEAMSDNGADAAARDGRAEGGGSSGAEGAGNGGAVESEELVAVCCGTGLFSSIGKCTGLDCVATIFEPLDRALSVVDF